MNVAAITGEIITAPRRALGFDKKTVLLSFDIMVNESKEDWESEKITDIIPAKIPEYIVKENRIFLAPGVKVYLTGALQHTGFLDASGRGVIAWGINGTDIISQGTQRKKEESKK